MHVHYQAISYIQLATVVRDESMRGYKLLWKRVTNRGAWQTFPTIRCIQKIRARSGMPSRSRSTSCPVGSALTQAFKMDVQNRRCRSWGKDKAAAGKDAKSDVAPFPRLNNSMVPDGCAIDTCEDDRPPRILACAKRNQVGNTGRGLRDWETRILSTRHTAVVQLFLASILLHSRTALRTAFRGTRLQGESPVVCTTQHILNLEAEIRNGHNPWRLNHHTMGHLSVYSAVNTRSRPNQYQLRLLANV